MKKTTVRRLLHTSGGFCTVVGVSVLDTLAVDDVEYEDYLVIFSDVRNPIFFSESGRQAKKIHLFKRIFFFQEIFVDKKNSKIDTDVLASEIEVEINELFIYSNMNSECLDAYRTVFRDAVINTYEEGMMGYCYDLFKESRTGGIHAISKIVTTNFFRKIYPQILKQVELNVVRIEEETLRQNIQKYTDRSKFPTFQNKNNASVLVLSSPFWMQGKVSFEKVVSEHRSLVHNLLEKGLIVYFKDHPRDLKKIYTKIYLTLPNTENFIDVSEFCEFAEATIKQLNPSFVVGIGSTALFFSYSLYKIPAFVYWSKFSLAVYSHEPQDLVAAAIFLRYLPQVKSILSQDIKKLTANEVRAKATEIAENQLSIRGSSLDDPIVQRTYQLTRMSDTNQKIQHQLVEKIVLHEISADSNTDSEILSSKQRTRRETWLGKMNIFNKSSGIRLRCKKTEQKFRRKRSKTILKKLSKDLDELLLRTELIQTEILYEKKLRRKSESSQNKREDSVFQSRNESET